ncbi:hypothetical protein Cni_G11551 [Canna indica]|uniref:DUF4378 domain-containing protein n=1 Tax=Canna indica TaxID=4628 RepID=A0AAQ3K6J4_9LILI|nr:hypothetical protein Cni_G11551 [Canna indica]
MSLAITERKPQQQRRHGGFVGIFFQLLDWNRRLAKKKLLPRKLLPPARAGKSPAKKFAADDKMPLAKLLVIDDENQGGFPSAKKPDVDFERGMRDPGLVARLMGLESIPVVAHERPRKATDSGCLGEECIREFHRIDQYLCVEDGVNRKLDSRPQKLQKTGGFLERHPIDGGREEPGASGKKKALSSSSKNKLHKPPLPAKSPRLPSGRLMKAATRILEPGLQSRSRIKSSIAYVDSSLVNAKSIDVFTSLKDSDEPFCDPVVESSMSYRRLGGTLRLEQGDEESLRPQISSSTLEMSNASCSDAGYVSLAMQDEQNRIRKTSVPVQCKTSVQDNLKDIKERNRLNTKKNVQDGSSPMLWRNQLRHNESTMLRDKVAFGSKVCSRKQARRDVNKLNGTKGSAFIRRNISNYGRVNSTYEQSSHRRTFGHNTLDRNIARKRTNIGLNDQSTDTIRSSCGNPSLGNELRTRKVLGPTSDRSVCKSCIKSSSNNENNDDFIFRNNDIVSFTFNSPARQASRSSSYKKLEKRRRTRNGCLGDICSSTLLLLDAQDRNLVSNERIILRGDELSNLLEQKIRELASMGRDKLVARESQSTSVLEDVGTAYMPERNDYDHSRCSNKIDISSGLDFSFLLIPQAKVHRHEDDAKFRPAASTLDIDNNQLSPVSIFDASFSNESCSYGSLNASSAGKLQVGLAESCRTTQSIDLDTDLLDSATSVDFRSSIMHKIQHLTCPRSCNYSTHCNELGISKSELCEARHFISNAVLLLESFTLYRPDGSIDVSPESFMLDILHAIADSLQIGPKIDASYTEVKERDQLKELLFDCIIESLDSKYGWSCTSGYMTYCKIPSLLKRAQLIGEVLKEIRGWIDLEGKFLDDLVEHGMRDSTGNWTDCGMGAFEAGMEIESSILQTLVDEMVIDFC